MGALEPVRAALDDDLDTPRALWSLDEAADAGEDVTAGAALIGRGPHPALSRQSSPPGAHAGLDVGGPHQALGDVGSRRVGRGGDAPVRLAVPGGPRLLTPVFRFGWRIHVRGGGQPPGDGRSRHLPQPRVGDRLVPAAVGAAPAHHVRRQGRVPGRLEDQAPVPGPRHDPHRPLGRRRQPSGARRRRRCPRDAASCSASTPRAPAAATAGCTRATPARPGWRCGPGAPLVPVGMLGTREIQPPGRNAPRPFRPCEIRIGRPIDVGHYRDRPDDHLICASSPTS